MDIVPPFANCTCSTWEGLANGWLRLCGITYLGDSDGVHCVKVEGVQKDEMCKRMREPLTVHKRAVQDNLRVACHRAGICAYHAGLCACLSNRAPSFTSSLACREQISF